MEQESKIYIAGHTGLFGSTTLRLLKEKGYKNFVLRTHSELDLTRQAEVEKFFAEERPDYVFVMCGKVGGIKANSENMFEFSAENLKMNMNIIESAHKSGVKKLLYLGSSCMYPKKSPNPIKEESLLQGEIEPTNEGYALAKIIGLKLCRYLKKQYGDSFISCIPSNVYGPGDSFDESHNHVIPALIKRFHNAKILNSESVEIWGSGKPQRDFLYIEDAVEACIKLVQDYDGVEPVNIGTGKPTSIKILAETVAKVVGFNGNLFFDTSKPDGMMLRALDSEKILSIGWKSKTSLEEGLKKTYEYFLNEVNN